MVCRLGFAVLCLLAPAATAQGPGAEYVTWNLPRWAQEALRSAGLGARFELFFDLNPYYQRGDFDGDGQIDLAVQIVEKTSHKRGIAIVHASDRSVHVLGAGQRLGNAGDDFSWLWVWRVETRRGSGPSREALYVEKPESASGWIVWDGHTYTWLQGAD